MLVATAAAANPFLSQPKEQPDRIAIEPREDLLELAWSDTEERLQGSLHPAVPRVGEPLQVVIQLGSFQGAAFEGPITLTLREEGRIHGKTVTVSRGERHWQATFIPETTGIHRLDVSFRTTRYKALHAAFHVESSRVPRMLAWGLLGLCAVGLIGYTVRNLLKGERPGERSTALSDGPAPVGAPPPEAPVADIAPAPEAQTASAPPPPAPISAPLPEPEAAPTPTAAPPPTEPAAPEADPSTPSAAEPENKPAPPQ
jgi:hypothetical protein